jgi:aspartyl aminopeptidase
MARMNTPIDTTSARALASFIDASPSPRHAAERISADLCAAGYRPLSLQDADWSLSGGGYVVRHGASVVAFYLADKMCASFRIIGAHTDSPHLRLKPNAAYHCEGCRQLSVETYGGLLLNSWLDRDLGIAGTVFTADGKEHVVRVHQALARVPQLAIHLDRKINDDGLKLNAQTHLAPVWGLANDAEPRQALYDVLAQGQPFSGRDIISHDLSLYDITPSAFGGARNELIFASRLDNLASCHAGLQALLTLANKNNSAIPVLACFDHEEVGSQSATGAEGPLLATVLERIAITCGLSRSAYLAVLSRSQMISADMAHAVHPNYADRHEPRHKPVLGGGPVLKSNSNQRYATTAAMASMIERIARAEQIPLQNFVARTDLGCGSTIGPITAAQLGIAVADVGNPMWSMHSIRECAATSDHEPYVRLMRGFYQLLLS